MKHTLLFVDDEENILKALTRLFHRTGHEILCASNGQAALEAMQDKRISLILSDQRMPGMSGTEFLREARRIQPEAVRIMLTGYSDIQAAIEAINSGQVYRFLAKPWEDRVLVETVAEALSELDIRREHTELQKTVQTQNEKLKELNEVLEDKVAERTAELYETLNNVRRLNATLKEQNTSIIKGYAGLIDLRFQPLGDHCRRVARMVGPVCKSLGLADSSEIQQITIAALLHDIGKVGLADVTLAKDYKQLIGDELVEMKKHPVIGQGQVQVLSDFIGAAIYIRNHHENFDGSGYPDGLSGEAIPLGARIIRVLDSYDRAIYKKGHLNKPVSEELLEGLYKERGRKYDYDVILALIDVLKLPSDRFEQRGELKLKTEMLEPGMTLSRDIRTKKGVLVLPSDEFLSQEHINKLKNYGKLYSIEDAIYIYSNMHKT